MKNKFVFGLTVATLSLFASCSSDETVEVPTGRAIQFTENFVDNSTRTIVNEASDFKEFQVYGWVKKGEQTGLLFDGEKVSNEDGTWSYTNTQYWIEGAVYTFSAVSGLANGEFAIYDKEKVALDAPTITKFSSDGKSDLMYGKSAETSYEGKKSGNPTVSFTFQHQLAKVKFSFKNGLGEHAALGVHVMNIKITDPIETGDVTLSDEQYQAKWSAQAKAAEGTTPTALDFGNAPLDEESSAISTTEFSPCSKENLVIPAKDQDYTVTFTTVLYQAGIAMKSVDHTATITGMTFEPGKAYNFTAELNADNLLGKDDQGNDTKLEPIVFTAEAESWTTEEDKALANYPKTDNSQQQTDKSPE